MKDMLVWYLLIGIVMFGIHCILGSIASGIAYDKGYEGGNWFWLCFFAGILAYIVIAAMPNQKLLDEQRKTNELLQKLLEQKKEEKTDENTDKFSFDDLPMI